MTPKIRKALEAAFRATAYRARLPQGPVDLRVGEPSSRLDCWLQAAGVENWAFVTACNPRATALDESANRQRHDALRERVSAAGWISVEGLGVPLGNDWRPELSLLIAGIARGDALRLGREFDQLAIVAGRRGMPAQLEWLDEDRQH